MEIVNRTTDPYNNKTVNALAIRRIHKLEPRSMHIHSADELRIWWLENSLPYLLQLDDLQDETITQIDVRHLRAKAWNSINLSAQRIVEIQKALRPIVHRFEGYLRLGSKLNEWCRSFLVVVGGSIGRFESQPDSDADISLIVDSANFERCYELMQGMVVWPLKLKLLQERIGRKFDGDKLITDKLVYCFDYRTVLPSSLNQKKFRYLRQLLTCGLPLHKTIEYRRYLAPYYADRQKLPRQELALELTEEIRKHFSKLRDRDPGHRRFWRSWTKFVRLCVMSLALKYLDAREWRLNYFTLAELLYKQGVFKADEWNTIKQAVVWSLSVRANSQITAANNGEGIVALNNFRSLGSVTEKLLTTRLHCTLFMGP